MTGLYLAGLAFSLGGLALIDRRLRLALWVETRRTLLTVALAVAVFLAWDLVGVGLGIFFIGGSSLLTGIVIAPEVPLEEPVFLTLLAYQTLLLWRWFSLRSERRAPSPRSSEAAA